MWYIVVLVTVDWYTILHKIKVVKASTSKDAVAAAMQDEPNHVSAQAVYQCGRTKPKEV